MTRSKKKEDLRNVRSLDFFLREYFRICFLEIYESTMTAEIVYIINYTVCVQQPIVTGDVTRINVVNRLHKVQNVGNVDDIFAFCNEERSQFVMDGKI